MALLFHWAFVMVTSHVTCAKALNPDFSNRLQRPAASLWINHLKRCSPEVTQCGWWDVQIHKLTNQPTYPKKIWEVSPACYILSTEAKYKSAFSRLDSTGAWYKGYHFTASPQCRRPVLTILGSGLSPGPETAAQQVGQDDDEDAGACQRAGNDDGKLVFGGGRLVGGRRHLLHFIHVGHHRCALRVIGCLQLCRWCWKWCCQENTNTLWL